MFKINQLANRQFVVKKPNQEWLQSYDSIVAAKVNGEVLLSDHYDYSRTTMRYLVRFLGDKSIAEVRKKIKQGIYKMNLTVDGEILKENE